MINEHMLAHALEWLEEKTKPLFVAAALILYAIAIYRITQTLKPLENLNQFLVEALIALTIPFGIILLQEMLELVAKISENNLLSARHQFEIVLLVIVRSFFKSFSKVNSYQ
ncbi:hypothetical protein KFU94_60080 [Chloroflexi bacterium TSY]|nr:hypothetical protein [Chloroflexi bacterium TSY]